MAFIARNRRAGVAAEATDATMKGGRPPSTEVMGDNRGVINLSHVGGEASSKIRGWWCVGGSTTCVHAAAGSILLMNTLGGTT
jgi:hypothetical protein